MEQSRWSTLKVAALGAAFFNPIFGNVVIAQPADPDARAAATEAAMTQDERTIMTRGILAIPLMAGPLPEGAVVGAGYVPGIPRLGVPALTETDASLGVSYVGGMRGDGGATALPSGMAIAATWNPALARTGGAMIAGEARAKGFNVLLAGGVNLMREPRNGRTFEYLGEDPLLAGKMAGASIAGIQSRNILSTVKHLAFNNQESHRHDVDVKLGDAAARESELLAFEIAIEDGQPGAVMCAYNKVGGRKACDSDYLLNRVLKQDWGYKGFVMSDWGSVPGVSAALSGLDQQSGSQLDPAPYFGDELARKGREDKAYAARLHDMNRRILRSIYATGLDRNPPVIAPIDLDANAKVAQQVAEQGIVLLRNRGDILPLARSAKSIAVIGGYADSGVLSGGGSSQVHGKDGPAITVPMGGEGIVAAVLNQQYHRSSPLKAIKAMADKATVTFRDGRYVSEAVTAASQAEVAIVFATQWTGEMLDSGDLNLPSGQDALIVAVAKANPNTIVVLETGGPVVMPWLDQTAAVLSAWYPGARGGEAIARVLFGEVNPSGKLPATFPASTDQLPRPVLDGLPTAFPEVIRSFEARPSVPVDYDIEGADIGYRWFARKDLKPLFPFGFGLSYTTFAQSGLAVSTGARPQATLTVTNTGKRAGATVAQVYLTAQAGKPVKRLAAFERVELAPGESRKVTMPIDPRLLANWTGKGWTIPAGKYAFTAAESAADGTGPSVEVSFAPMKLKP